MIRIVTDSTADLTDSLLTEWGINIIPLNVIFGGTTYADGIDLSKEQFYEKMAVSKELPSTSQPSPAIMKDCFQKILDAGDDVYYVGLASTLSGTIQSAKIGRDMVDAPDRVTIFDSLSVTFGQGQLALAAAMLAKDGKTADEITAELTSLRKRQKIIFSVASLDNLRKSGRINNLSFLFGSLLNIKPIMMVDTDGVVQVYDKVRGKKNAHLAILRHLEEHPVDPTYLFGLGHTHDIEKAHEYEAELDRLGITNHVTTEICGVVGTHVGQGTIGLIYISK